MTDNDCCKSVWNKLFDCVNSGVAWTSSQIKSACPPKKKKGDEESANGYFRKPLEQDKDKDKDKDKNGGVDSSSSSSPESGAKKSPYVAPSEICPTVKACCYIKMQDPCRPCCCETKLKPPPCPPKSGHQEQREPVCGCELCQKNPGNEKCCDKSRAFRGLSIDREYFEKA